MSTKLKSKAFSDSGIYIMRKADLYMIVDCGTNGQNGNCGHAHNDTLSFELYAGDKTFILDPGAYIYNADYEMRNLFRSTAYHNTIVIDKKEMNRFYKYVLFSMEDDAIPIVNKWFTSDEYDFLDAQHNGYARLADPVIHRRQVLFSKTDQFWIISDILTGKQKYQIEQYYHFAPMPIKKINQNTVITSNDGTNLLLMRTDDYKSNIELIDGWVSYSYGMKIESQIVKCSGEFILPVRFFTVLYPYEKYYESLIETVRHKLQKYLKSKIW